MVISPRAAPPDLEPQVEILVLGNDRDGAASSPPWFTRTRHLMPLAAVVVAVNFPGTWTMSPEHAVAPSSRYESAFGTFEPMTVSGTGTAEVSLPATWAARARSGIITIGYPGPGRFRPRDREGARPPQGRPPASRRG
jgi:hypothetical protein